MAKPNLILGIETSCDETAAAVVSFDGRKFEVLGNAIASQVELHKLTGGVVPEVAAREHVTVMVPTIKLALKRAGVDKQRLDAVAVTYGGPSLLPALLVGIDTANALSMSLNIPLIKVHHTTGHIYSNFLSSQDKKINVDEIRFPLLALSVSGGHTELIYMESHLKFKKIGATLDDAAGETFDKTARILGLPYPGGPEISKRAQLGNADAFTFPRPMLKDKSLNFSFAGLKTAVLYKVQEMTKKRSLSEQQINDLAASIEQAIVDSLVGKTLQALEKYPVKTLTLGGGVAANTKLRKTFEQKLAAQFPKIKYLQPQIEYATDNAAMIAAIGALKYQDKKTKSAPAKIGPQWEI